MLWTHVKVVIFCLGTKRSAPLIASFDCQSERGVYVDRHRHPASECDFIGFSCSHNRQTHFCCSQSALHLRGTALNNVYYSRFPISYHRRHFVRWWRVDKFYQAPATAGEVLFSAVRGCGNMSLNSRPESKPPRPKM